MFAGAAREAVFSNADVVRRVKADFIPVALKAGLVNHPPVGPEGALYREIARSRPAPQGICVANSDAKVLDWALMFDDDKSVLGFLDHCLKRYAEFPDAKKPVPAERYMRYPSRKLSDVKDTRQEMQISDGHAGGARCPAKPALRKGTLVGRVVGRALDAAGKPVIDAVLQENYLEARFEVPVEAQQRFTQALAAAGSKRFKVPDELVAAVVSHAFLGQLDVNPLGGRQIGGKIDHKNWKFWAQRTSEDTKKLVRIRITGQSDVAGSVADIGGRKDGRRWQHRVKLAWEGYLDVDGEQITHLVMEAVGQEKLRWGNPLAKLTTKDVIQHLPAGRTLDVDCDVRYGLIAVPCSADEVGEKPARARPANGAQQQRFAAIRGKHQRVQQGVQRWQQQGKSVAPIGKIMQHFGTLMKAGKIDEAEAVLERAIELLEGRRSDAEKPKRQS